jgi:hypothetical protein
MLVFRSFIFHYVTSLGTQASKIFNDFLMKGHVYSGPHDA